MPEHFIDQALLQLADWKLQKQAFVPSEAMAAAAGGGAGGPPMDPAMMGGGGGMPPMDPAMMGGGGGMPPTTDPTAGAPPIDIASIVQQAVQQAMQQSQGGAPGAPGAPGAAGPGKGAKIDPGMIYMELGRCRKLLTAIFNNAGWELPPDILDDQMVAQSVAGGSPASQPTTAPPGAAGAAGGGEQGAPGLPGIGESGPVNPIEAPKSASVQDMNDMLNAVEWLRSRSR